MQLLSRSRKIRLITGEIHWSHFWKPHFWPLIWEEEIFNALGVSSGIMQEVVQPGTVMGRLSEEIGFETGLGGIPVIATGSHDTASAVAAVPAEGDDWAYISSGTWSLMGVETTEPVINADSMRFNFTNEGESAARTVS